MRQKATKKPYNRLKFKLFIGLLDIAYAQIDFIAINEDTGLESPRVINILQVQDIDY